MNPQELRIGNYVNIDNHDFELGVVLSLDPIESDFHDAGINYEVVGKNDQDFAEYDDVHRVPLTEQWLKDFGLMEENGFYNLRDGWDIYCHYSSMDNCAHIWGMTGNTPIFGDDFFIIKCEYVHTFQNAVFALTGKELTR